MNTWFPVGLFGGSIGPGEVVLILLVALLLFGSKNLPRIARTLGKSVEEFKRAARDISTEIMHAEEDDKPPPPKSLPRKPDSNESRDA